MAGTEIANVIETDHADRRGEQPQGLADRFETATANIEAGTQMSTWEQPGIFLRSWGDPDDQIGYRFSAFIAVDDR